MRFIQTFDLLALGNTAACPAAAFVLGMKLPRAAGPYLAAAKLEDRLLVVLYQAAKGFVCCCF
jgi:hypothetical protein